MNRPGPTIEDIKREANRRPHDVLRWCGIAEEFGNRSYISMCSPMRKDTRPSFTIWFKNGTLSFREEDLSAKGDVLDFVAYMNGWFHGPNRGVDKACRFLKDKLGLDRVDPHKLADDRRASRKRQAQAQKDSAEKLAKNQLEAFKMFTGAAPLRDTPGWRYLKEVRGIDLDLLPRGPKGGDLTPGSLRFMPECWHAEAKRKLPCIIACCTDLAGDIKAVHRTFIGPNGERVKDLRGWQKDWPARKVWPSFTGLFIPLWRGGDGMRLKDAIANGVLETIQMGEGVEKSLAMALAQPANRTWAFISLGNLRSIVLPPNCDGVIVQRDNEWKNRQAVESFEIGLRALRDQGVPAQPVSAFGGKDFDDVLREGL